MSVSLLCGFVLTASVRAEVLVRWDRDQVPSPDSLGVSTLVIPAKNKAAAQRALEQGYSVVLEVDAAGARGVRAAGRARDGRDREGHGDARAALGSCGCG